MRTGLTTHQAELKRAGPTYDELAERLKKHGFKDETKASIADKLSRGTFPTPFFLAALVAMGAEVVKLEDIYRGVSTRREGRKSAMNEPGSNSNEEQQGEPPKKPFPIVHIFRALKRCYDGDVGTKYPNETPHQRNERLVANWTRRLGIFTFVMVVVAVGTGYILWLTDHTLRANQRAFVFLKELDIQQVQRAPDDLRWYFVIKWENSGTTQTRNLVITNSCDSPPDFSKSQTRRSVMGPRQITGQGACHWHVNDLEKTRQTGGYVTVASMATYADVFGDHHVTKFCRIITLQSDPRVPAAPLQHTASGCPHFVDCADDECAKQ